LGNLCLLEGGFDLLGRTVDQIRTTEQINAAKATCCDLNLDGLIIIGGETREPKKISHSSLNFDKNEISAS
jgi:6-phosphofructokinase